MNIEKPIGESVELLMTLKELLKSYMGTHNPRLDSANSDIDRCIDHANYYLINLNRYTPLNFKFHLDLVNLVDLIRDNDFGIAISSENLKKQNDLSKKILDKVNQLIIINNENKEEL